jgi:hypothetical protein
MARSRSVLALLTCAAFNATVAQQAPAETKPEPSNKTESAPPVPGSDQEKRDRGPGGRGGPDSRGDGRRDWRKNRENLTPEQMREKAMKDLEKLTPEQRNEVWRAVWAVLNLPQEEKQKIIGMDEERRKKMREEIDRTVQAIGVKDEQRRKFFHRYFTGRRELEEQLKKESEERRHVLLKELDDKLRQEFSDVQIQVEQKVEQK